MCLHIYEEVYPKERISKEMFSNLNLHWNVFAKESQKVQTKRVLLKCFVHGAIFFKSDNGHVSLRAHDTNLGRCFRQIEIAKIHNLV